MMVCLTPFGSCFEPESPDGNEKHPSMIVNNQPAFHPRPVGRSESEYQDSDRKKTQGLTRQSFASSRTSFTRRSRFWSDSSSRRPLISAPSGFRHVQSGSFRFEFDMRSSRVQSASRPCQSASDDFVTREKKYVHPLELGIYLPDHRISPILPHFEFPSIITPPPPAYCAERSEQDHLLSRQRSHSSTSFHIPRRQLVGSPSTTQDGVLRPRIPAKSKYRARAYTAPEVDTIRERVASALIEVEYLQKQIDDAVERQNLYASIWPSISHSMAHTMPNLEPMPSIPALPPEAPSFAERLNADMQRPQNASCQRILVHEDIHEGKKAGKSRITQTCDDGPLPPPLPLVFRPPLRKKKSFSAVSTWLFPGQETAKNASFESITNKPKPVKGNNGFYQIVTGPSGRRSYESFDSISTWHTEDEDRTVPRTWSLGSTPVQNQDEQPLERTATFGKNDARLGKPHVGVAI